MSSTSDDDPFRPPSDDDRGPAQEPQQPGWGWGQQPQDPARTSWEASRDSSSQQPPQAPQPPAGYGPPGDYGSAQGNYGAPAYAQSVPDHPRSTTALVTGLIALVGGMMCGLPLLAGPFALFIGRNAVKEIDQQPGRFGGRGAAMAGYVLGIIATVLLGLALLAIVGFVLLFATVGFA